MISLAPSFWKTDSALPNDASLGLVSASSQAAGYPGAAADYNIAGNKLTMQQWVKHTALGGTQVYQGQFDFSTNQEAYTCYYQSSGGDQLRFRLESPGGLQDYVQWARTPPIGTWVNYAFVWDGALTIATGSMKLYINGVDQGATANLTVNNITALKASTASYFVGSWFGGSAAGSYYNGLIDEVRLWNAALTGPEILANYNQQISGATAGLFAYQQFNNDYVDQVSGKNLGGLNAPVFNVDVPFP